MKALVLSLLLAAPAALASGTVWHLWIDCGSLAGEGIAYFIVGDQPYVYAFSCGRTA